MKIVRTKRCSRKTPESDEPIRISTDEEPDRIDPMRTNLEELPGKILRSRAVEIPQEVESTSKQQALNMEELNDVAKIAERYNGSDGLVAAIVTAALIAFVEFISPGFWQENVMCWLQYAW